MIPGGKPFRCFELIWHGGKNFYICKNIRSFSASKELSNCNEFDINPELHFSVRDFCKD